MKKFITLAALLAMTASASAQSTTAKVPTGIDVKGPTYYRMVPVMGGHRVQYQRDVCDRKAIEQRVAGCVFGSERSSDGLANGDGTTPGEVNPGFNN